MRKKYIKGVKVLKISTEGKPLKRIVYINAKPEYFEIAGMRTTKLFDMARHLSGVEAITFRDKSPEFERFRAVHARGTEEITPVDTCCVVTFSDRTISLVFENHCQRNEFVYVLSVLRRIVDDWYERGQRPDVPPLH
eukprot:Selendium_serpulae@DN3313_c0_g1_i3.p1